MPLFCFYIAFVRQSFSGYFFQPQFCYGLLVFNHLSVNLIPVFDLSLLAPFTSVRSSFTFSFFVCCDVFTPVIYSLFSPPLETPLSTTPIFGLSLGLIAFRPRPAVIERFVSFRYYRLRSFSPFPRLGLLCLYPPQSLPSFPTHLFFVRCPPRNTCFPAFPVFPRVVLRVPRFLSIPSTHTTFPLTPLVLFFHFLAFQKLLLLSPPSPFATSFRP